MLMAISSAKSDEYGDLQRAGFSGLGFSELQQPLDRIRYGKSNFGLEQDEKLLLRLLCAQNCDFQGHEGSVKFLALVYVADNIPENRRAVVFGSRYGVLDTTWRALYDICWPGFGQQKQNVA